MFMFILFVYGSWGALDSIKDSPEVCELFAHQAGPFYKRVFFLFTGGFEHVQTSMVLHPVCIRYHCQPSVDVL